MASGTMFKFVAADGIGNSQKRHQARRACENCRRRKKACHHTEPQLTSKSKPVSDNSLLTRSSTPSDHVSFPGDHEDRAHISNSSRDSTSSGPDVESLGRKVTSTTNEDRHDIQTVPQEESSHHVLHRQDDLNSRFIGDLSPEGIFLAATSPDATRGGSVGVWLTTNANKSASEAPHPSLQSPSNLFYGTGSLIQQVFIPMLEQQCLSAIPSPAMVNVLTKIYFDKVYPILPIIDEADYRELPSTDPHRLLLLQGICLAASKNFAARKHLVLDEALPTLSCREFGEKVSGAMRISIEMGLVTNRVVIIQALGLMTQFADNPVGDDLSSQLCTQAVHHVQSLGIHLKGDHDWSSKKLFCCIWAIDKLNAALNGRTVLMHERDLGVDVASYFEAQQPSFRLFLQVIDLLDKVIDIYRPASSENPILTWDFPSFEDVVSKCGLPNIGVSTLATIETLYHAIAILSCRSKTWADPQRSSSSYLRQSLSSVVLSSTVSCEFQDHKLTLFPFIPYAMSLAMSIAYREMRHSKLTLHRTRSRVQFQTLCDALSGLEGIFWAASATSDMGKKLLKEMDRVFSTVSSSDRRLEQPSTQYVGSMHVSSSAPTNVDNMTAENQIEMDGNGSTPTQTMQENIDPSIFDTISDIDLFGMFDPAFDLDGFDACLEGNLNPAFPTNFQ